jgi:hypothetical protein
MSVFITYRLPSNQNQTQPQQERMFREMYNLPVEPMHIPNIARTRTILRDEPRKPDDWDTMLVAFSRMVEEANAISRLGVDMHTMYESFFVPKASGGLRQINAPKEGLKELQRRILYLFSQTFRMVTHDSAHAYTAHRSTVTCLNQHQANESNWFLKLDLIDFFPSCTREFVASQMGRLYPTCFLTEQNFLTLLNVCVLDGALPQGAPTSPLLSNLVMIPYDYNIANTLWNFDTHHFVYTRYADDILVSCKEHFNPREISGVVQKCMEDSPFRLKEEKTRYGSRAGRNWNLGLMLNKDNDLTLGAKEKQRLRAAIDALYKDRIANHPWPPSDVAQLAGRVSYFRSVEPQYADSVLQRFAAKYQLDWKTLLKCMEG